MDTQETKQAFNKDFIPIIIKYFPYCEGFAKQLSDFTFSSLLNAIYLIGVVKKIIPEKDLTK